MAAMPHTGYNSFVASTRTKKDFWKNLIRKEKKNLFVSFYTCATQYVRKDLNFIPRVNAKAFPVPHLSVCVCELEKFAVLNKNKKFHSDRKAYRVFVLF